MNNQSVLALILAAGKGTRMYSSRPKVLQPLGGRAMIYHLLQTLNELDITHTAVVHGYLGEEIKRELQPNYPDLQWVAQTKQLGTGHAVLQALPLLQDNGITLILLGDCPLLKGESLQFLLNAAKETGAALLTTEVPNPCGYGRIIRNEANQVTSIVEEKDASNKQRCIKEINTGVMAIDNTLLQKFLPQIDNQNAQQEYYLTDLIALLYKDGHSIQAVMTPDYTQTLGINNRQQLAQAESIYRARQSTSLLEAGVTLIDPERIDVHGTLNTGKDVIIEANVMFKGQVLLGDGVYIESGCVLEDCTIGAYTTIYAMSVIEQSIVGEKAHIGPFARLRPKTELASYSKIGNFVEIKASYLGKGSKVNHLSYIGDAVLGEDVNIGAGTITCNYDGANKFQTIIGHQVFVGSNTALVAPVTLGDGVTIGAGSVISQDIDSEALAFTRAPIKISPHWIRPVKTKKET